MNIFVLLLHLLAGPLVILLDGDIDELVILETLITIMICITPSLFAVLWHYRQKKMDVYCYFGYTLSILMWMACGFAYWSLRLT